MSRRTLCGAERRALAWLAVAPLITFTMLFAVALTAAAAGLQSVADTYVSLLTEAPLLATAAYVAACCVGTPLILAMHRTRFALGARATLLVLAGAIFLSVQFYRLVPMSVLLVGYSAASVIIGQLAARPRGDRRTPTSREHHAR